MKPIPLEKVNSMKEIDILRMMLRDYNKALKLYGPVPEDLVSVLYSYWPEFGFCAYLIWKLKMPDGFDMPVMYFMKVYLPHFYNKAPTHFSSYFWFDVGHLEPRIEYLKKIIKLIKDEDKSRMG